MLSEKQKDNTIALLFDEGCSCIVRKYDEIRIFRKRGVRDLLQLLHEEHDFTSGAFIADKVVGKGAAALIVLCGIQEVFADIISTPARQLLDKSRVRYTYSVEVPNITSNRTKDGLCPVERVCADCQTAKECLPRIEEFVARMAAHKSA